MIEVRVVGEVGEAGGAGRGEAWGVTWMATEKGNKDTMAEWR